MSASAQVPLQFPANRLDRLRELREMYEPYAEALAQHFLIALPPWLPDHVQENWQTAEWGRVATPSSASDPFQTGADDAA